MSVRFCAGWMKSLRGTIVPFGRSRELPLAPRNPLVAAVGVSAPVAGAQVVQSAHLESVTHLPDAVEDGAVTLIARRQRVRAGAAEVELHRERHDVETAERLRICVVEPRQCIRRRGLPVLAQSLGQRGAPRSFPRAFVGVAAVSRARRRAARFGVKQLGLRGATIGGHVNGESLSLPKFDPFWAKANELGVVVFMHPGGADNIVKPDAWKARGDIGNIIGNPLVTTYFLTRLIFDGTFDKFPNLKVCGAHGGGYLPSYFQRTEVACDVRGNAMCANKKHPREYLKTNIMADTMVLTDEGLRHLVAEMGISQVVYGTDNPLNWPVPVDMIVNHSTLTDAQKEQILSGNLMKLLRITAPGSA
jgi:predicted TIM-barrel fold metal-dependent hydrolase